MCVCVCVCVCGSIVSVSIIIQMSHTKPNYHTPTVLTILDDYMS